MNAAVPQSKASATLPCWVGLRIVVAGMSAGPVCGVRDHARVVSASLVAAGAEVSTVWGMTGVGRSDALGRWVIEVADRCQEEGAQAVLLHYSVFAFTRHGVPSGVPVMAARLRRLGVPVVLFAHEFAYPWGRRAWRGTVHAITQRAVLPPLVGVSSSVLVATTDRVNWMGSRRWLPRRPVTVAPVPSNIRPHPSRPVASLPGRIGVFSFGAEGLAIDLVTGAVADIARRSPGTHLALIGAPGPESDAGSRWRRTASEAGCPLVFTGVADEAEISRQLASCDVVVLPDPGGPSSRKGSLAAALAHGRPVVALDGPQTWRDLVDAAALVIVIPHRDALGIELGRLLDDPAARSALGARAGAFYEERLSPERSAEAVLCAITDSISRFGSSVMPTLVHPARF